MPNTDCKQPFIIKDVDTNFVYISEKLQKKKCDIFNRLTDLFKELDIPFGILEQTNDIWARDYMPIAYENGDFLVYDYNPDYLQDISCKHLITDPKLPCEELKLSCRETKLKIDGGNVVRCGDYIVMTEKVLSENGISKYTQREIPIVINRLKEALGQEIIIIPWHDQNPYIEDEDHYGHSDGFIHWCGGNKLLMADHWQIDKNEADEIKQILEQHGFEVTVMKFDVPQSQKEWNWAYINYLQVGHKIIVPTFGIGEDKQALKYIQEANPDCEVYPFRMRDVAADGGALHCITWNINKKS